MGKLLPIITIITNRCAPTKIIHSMYDMTKQTMKTTYIVTSGCISRENLGARPGGKYPGLFPKWDLGDEGANPRQPKLAVCH